MSVQPTLPFPPFILTPYSWLRQNQLVYVTMPFARDRQGRQVWADVKSIILTVDRERRQVLVRHLSAGLRGTQTWESMGRVRSTERD